MLETTLDTLQIEPKPKRKFASSPKEVDIESRPVSAERELGGGTEITRLIELKDDGRAVFKPADYEDRELNLDSHQRCERAAYLVDRFLDFGLIPSTVIRTVGNFTGSAQEFIADGKTWDTATVAERQKTTIDAFKSLWLLDYILYNRDRHTRNFLVKEDGTLVAIDHGNTLIGGYFSGRFYCPKEENITDDYGVDTMHTNSGYFDTVLPEVFVNKIKAFAADKEKQRLLFELLCEQINTEAATACINRIKFIAGLIGDDYIISSEHADALKVSNPLNK